MTSKRDGHQVVCLRCDWSGASTATACPACGAGLYRVPHRPEASRADPSRRAAPTTTLLDDDATGSDGGRTADDRFRRLVGAFVAVSLAVGGLWFLAGRDAHGALRHR